MIVVPIWDRRKRYLTTAVESTDRRQVDLQSQSGQSLIEFVVSLPLLLGLVVIMTRVNMAIQASIVNQQYARAHALSMTYNSAFYPTLDKQQRLIQTSANQMILGVSENSPLSDEAGANSTYNPEASVVQVARSKRNAGSNAEHEEPNLRGLVRVRNTVTLCAPSAFFDTGGAGQQPVYNLAPDRKSLSGPILLSEGSRFDFCGSKVKYE